MQTQVEEKVVEEVKAWSKHALETPNPYFNNLPACPYAQKAWAEDKVGFVFNYGPSMEKLCEVLRSFDDDKDLILVVDFLFDENVETFDSYFELLNNAIAEGAFFDRDLWVMGFHPHDEDNEFIDGEFFEPLTDKEYALIFVQRLSKLHEHAEKIKEKGYYTSYEEGHDASRIYQQRVNLYRRLKNGDEAA
jgi:hypothetical protein|tara:strand:+ start:1657 stop:2229 length:573 start_codon:yes stop_codon:yes gene_type:complete